MFLIFSLILLIFFYRFQSVSLSFSSSSTLTKQSSLFLQPGSPPVSFHRFWRLYSHWLLICTNLGNCPRWPNDLHLSCCDKCTIRIRFFKSRNNLPFHSYISASKMLLPSFVILTFTQVSMYLLLAPQSYSRPRFWPTMHSAPLL